MTNKMRWLLYVVAVACFASAAYEIDLLHPVGSALAVCGIGCLVAIGAAIIKDGPS